MGMEKETITPDPASASFGSIGALLAAVRALIETHPDLPAYSQAYTRQMELQFSHLLASQAGEAAIGAFQVIRDAADPQRLISDRASQTK